MAGLSKIETKLKSLYASIKSLEEKKAAYNKDADAKIAALAKQASDLEKSKAQIEKFMKAQEEELRKAEEIIGGSKPKSEPATENNGWQE